MAIQLSEAVRNARLDSIETTIGGTAILRIYSGAMPASTATAVSGTMLVSMTLPADWMNAAATGQKTMLGTWSGTGDAGASTGTTAGYFRIWNNGVTVCGLQGTVTATGGGGDMTLDNASIASGQTVNVSSFTLTDANA